MTSEVPRMAIGRDTTFTWYGHACVEVQTPGGKVVLIDPWFGNPKSPRSAESVDRCDVMLVTHGHSDHMGEALGIASRTAAWMADDPRVLALAVAQLLGHADRVIGMNKGGTVEVAGSPDHDDRGGPLGRRLERLQPSARPSTSASRPASSSRSRTASASTTRATPTCSATCASSPSSAGPDLAILPIGGHLHDGSPRGRAGRRAARRRATSCRSTTGRSRSWPARPPRCGAELAARGLGDVEVHALEPGGSLS